MLLPMPRQSRHRLIAISIVVLMAMAAGPATGIVTDGAVPAKLRKTRDSINHCLGWLCRAKDQTRFLY
jgi:hypothetical protein